MTLVAIWTRQYINEKNIGDRIHMTDERMTKLVNEAYDAGYDAGKLQGRADLRQDIDEGKVTL